MEGESSAYTTSAADQSNVRNIEKELEDHNSKKSGGSAAASSSECRVPLAKIDEGAHKYVLVRASKTVGGEEQMFVRSASGAPYHADVARPLLDKLMEEKYENVKVLGGGRISLSHSDRKITIYGHSYGFGMADHQVSQSVIEADGTYKGYDISWHNDGY